MNGKQASLSAKRRQGAAFLLLVLMVLLVIVAATQWTVNGSLVDRQGTDNRIRARSMMAAIESAGTAGDWKSPLRLPINESNNERIEVTAGENRQTLTAVWLRGDVEISRLVRPLETPSDSLISQNR